MTKQTTTVGYKYHDEFPKKTPEEWLKDPRLAGVTVLDPDGWDRANFEESWAEEITLMEMQTRVAQSTVQILPSSPMHPRNILATIEQR